MSTETLTAEERADLQDRVSEPGGHEISRALAALDTALARAEAADQDHERKHVIWHEERRVTTALQSALAEMTARAEAAEESARAMRMTCRVNEADNTDQCDRRRAAESRLADATARFEELQRCCDRGVQHRATLDALETLLLRWTERSCEASNLAAACLELMHATPAPAATAEPENPEADERHAKLVSVADKLRASRILVERIEFELRNGFCGDCQRALALIRAAKEGA